jgi:hypothetical protein
LPAVGCHVGHPSPVGQPAVRIRQSFPDGQEHNAGTIGELRPGGPGKSGNLGIEEGPDQTGRRGARPHHLAAADPAVRAALPALDRPVTPRQAGNDDRRKVEDRTPVVEINAEFGSALTKKPQVKPADDVQRNPLTGPLSPTPPTAPTMVSGGWFDPR